MLDAVTIEPTKEADASIIWLHGLGADGHDFVDVIPSLSLPSNHSIRFIFPHAPRLRVTLNGGMVMPAWYDIAAIDLNAWQDEKGIRLAEESLSVLIHKEIEKGILPKRIILVGFSQGGALALHTALRFKLSLAGVAGLSTYLPVHYHLKKEYDPINQQIAIFLAHGLMDPIVSYWIGQKSLLCLQESGFNPQWYTYPIVHTVCLQELNDIGQWIQRVLT